MTAATRRAIEFFDAVINEYGIREGNSVRIPMRQCELARRKQLAASTVGAYLSAMGNSVVARHPHIVIVINRADEATPVSEPSTSRFGDTELFDAYEALVEAQARVIDVLARTARDPRGSRGSRGIREEIPSGGTPKEEGQGKEDLPPPSSRSLRADPARIRAGSVCEEVDPRWTAAEAEAVLLPLHRLAQRYGMKAMNNRAGLLAALQPFALDEIGYAVQRVEALVTGVGSKVSSPFGLLVRWARSGDGSHFSPPPTRIPGCALPPAEVLVQLAGGERESVLDPADSDAVTAMEATPECFVVELGQLDQLVARDHPNLTSHGIRPAMRHALRGGVFNEWIAANHTTDGTPQAHLAVTTGTPQAHLAVTAGTPQGHLAVSAGTTDGVPR